MKKLLKSEGFQYMLCIVIAILGTLFMCEFATGEELEIFEADSKVDIYYQNAESICAHTTSICVDVDWGTPDICLTAQDLLDALGIDHKCEDTET